MTTTRRATELLIGIALSLPARADSVVWDCSRGRKFPASEAHHLQPADVAKIATTEARRRRVDLSKYRQSSMCFDALDRDAQWTVFFDSLRSPPAPGDHFSVVVSDTTSAAEFWPGE